MTQIQSELRICIDVGSEKHYVAIGLSNGDRLDEFQLEHTPQGISAFFERIEKLKSDLRLPVSIAMEGYNGYARPIDVYALAKGYTVYNVNNHKLSRFREMFPGPAKTDPIDAWMIFDLFKVKDSLPLAKNALQRVEKASEVNEKLKHFTRRRRVLVQEKTNMLNRLQSDLHAVCPGLTAITGAVDNLWFLRFLASRDDLRSLVRMQSGSILKIKSVGKTYAQKIQTWQKDAEFSPHVNWMGPTIIQDVRRILQLDEEIGRLEKVICELIPQSEIASRIQTITGFGAVCASELAGEIGTISRFHSESSLALYLGMAVLDKSSGKFNATKSPRQVNCRAKMAMMTGVFKLIAQDVEAKQFYDKKRAEGKKHNQSVRALGRHIVRVIWSMLRNQRDYITKE